MWKGYYIMFKVGDVIDYGFYSNVTIVREIPDAKDNLFVLRDRHGNTKEVFSSLVQKHSIYHGDTARKDVVLLKDGTIFKLSQLSKSDLSMRRLVAMLDIELYWESNQALPREELLESRLSNEYKKSVRQYLLCKTIYCSAVLPKLSLVKALNYMGLGKDAINYMLGYEVVK